MASESDFTPLVTLPRWSFKLRQLFIWTAVIAVGCVALRGASSTWIGLMFGLTFVLLATSLLLVVFRRGADRAYWIGFSTFGWLYMLLLLFGWNVDPASSPDSPFRPSNLATTQLSNYCYHWLYDTAFERYYASTSGGGMTGGYAGYGSMPGMMGASGDMYGGSGMPGGGYPGGMPMGPGGMGGRPVQPPPAPGPNAGDFVNVAHSLWTIVLAALGGCLAHLLFATGPGRNQEAPRQISNLPS